MASKSSTGRMWGVGLLVQVCDVNPSLAECGHAVCLHPNEIEAVMEDGAEFCRSCCLCGEPLVVNKERLEEDDKQEQG